MHKISGHAWQFKPSQLKDPSLHLHIHPAVSISTMSHKRETSESETNDDINDILEKRPEKRTRVDADPISDEPSNVSVSDIKTQHLLVRGELERSIVTVLSHDGFSASTPQALNSFTALVEECWFSVACFVTGLAS